MRYHLPGPLEVIRAVLFTRAGRIALVVLALLGLLIFVGMSLAQQSVSNTFSGIVSSLASPTP